MIDESSTYEETINAFGIELSKYMDGDDASISQLFNNDRQYIVEMIALIAHIHDKTYEEVDVDIAKSFESEHCGVSFTTN